MKSLKYLSALGLVVLLLTYSGCGSKKDPEPSAQDKALTKLSKTWKCTAVTLTPGGTPTIASQPNYTYVNTLILTISGTAGQTTFNYTTTGRPANDGTKVTPWNSAGTFTFGTSDFATTVTRDDALPIGYVVTDTSLQLSFNYTGAGYVGGRVGQVTGNWVFTFTAQ